MVQTPMTGIPLTRLGIAEYLNGNDQMKDIKKQNPDMFSARKFVKGEPKKPKAKRSVTPAKKTPKPRKVQMQMPKLPKAPRTVVPQLPSNFLQSSGFTVHYDIVPTKISLDK